MVRHCSMSRLFSWFINKRHVLWFCLVVLTTPFIVPKDIFLFCLRTDTQNIYTIAGKNILLHKSSCGTCEVIFRVATRLAIFNQTFGYILHVYISLALNVNKHQSCTCSHHCNTVSIWIHLKSITWHGYKLDTDIWYDWQHPKCVSDLVGETTAIGTLYLLYNYLTSHPNTSKQSIKNNNNI